MGQVVVWGTGDTVTGRYKVNADKVAVSAAIEAIAGGIKVQWSPSDFEIISGVNWNILNKIWRVFSFSNSCIGSCQTYHSPAYLLKTPYSWSWGSTVNSLCGGVRSLPTVSDGTNTYNLRPARILPVSSSGQCSASAAESRKLPRIKFENSTTNNSNGVPTPQEIEQIQSITVISDSEDKSERETTIPPSVSLLAGGCGVGINFSDSSNIIISLQSCPAWVRIEDDQACPEGSCECVHGSEKCCIDPNSGVIIKKIRLV